jgi:hypothetical protein
MEGLLFQTTQALLWYICGMDTSFQVLNSPSVVELENVGAE